MHIVEEAQETLGVLFSVLGAGWGTFWRDHSAALAVATELPPPAKNAAREAARISE
jgi:hypothetical protein